MVNNTVTLMCTYLHLHVAKYFLDSTVFFSPSNWPVEFSQESFPLSKLIYKELSDAANNGNGVIYNKSSGFNCEIIILASRN